MKSGEAVIALNCIGPRPRRRGENRCHANAGEVLAIRRTVVFRIRGIDNVLQQLSIDGKTAFLTIPWELLQPREV
jgi:hypothetical protein